MLPLRPRAPSVFLLLLVGCSGTSSAGTPDGGDAHVVPADANTDARSRDSGTDAIWPRRDGAPRDERPRHRDEPPPAWDAPFPIDDEVGWRDRTEPLCNPYSARLAAFELWADERGVFALTDTFYNGMSFDTPWLDGTALLHNDGTGWRTWYQVDRGAGAGGQRDLEGLRGGPLSIWEGSGCQIRHVDGPHDTSCSWTGDLRLGSVADVHPVDPSSGWAFFHGDEVAWWDEDGLRIVAEVEGDGQSAIWGDAERYLLAREGALYQGGRSGEPVVLAELPPDTSVYDMWVNGWNDVWLAGGGAGLLHYDGSSWQAIETGFADDGVPEREAEAEWIHSVWGTLEEVYYARWGGFGRWTEATGGEVLYSWSTGAGVSSIYDIFGNATREELYLALSDSHTFHGYECGSTFIVWYDGERLRRF